jgi:acetyl-CoA carboxylase biotin carboxyl carrier protein
VIGADLDRFAQLRPGDQIRFAAVSLEEARAATLAARAALGPESVVRSPRQFVGSSMESSPSTTLETEMAALVSGWDPDGVVRVLDALARTGVTSFTINSGTGFTLSIERGGGAAPAPSAATALEQTDSLVAAPVLGVFYRRGGPDQPAFVEPGGRVAKGQVIGLIEVMKSYHEVTAPVDGVLAHFAIEDGQFVEYGQEIARITREQP